MSANSTVALTTAENNQSGDDDDEEEDATLKRSGQTVISSITIIITTSSSFKDFAHIHKSLQKKFQKFIFNLFFEFADWTCCLFFGSPVWFEPGRLLPPTVRLQDPFPAVLRCT